MYHAATAVEDQRLSIGIPVDLFEPEHRGHQEAGARALLVGLRLADGEADEAVFGGFNAGPAERL